MEPHDIEVRFKLPGKQGKDVLTSDKTPELLCEQWVKKMQKKCPQDGWKFIKGHMSGEARALDGEFWAIFRYA